MVLLCFVGPIYKVLRLLLSFARDILPPGLFPLGLGGRFPAVEEFLLCFCKGSAAPEASSERSSFDMGSEALRDEGVESVDSGLQET